jgi:cobalt-zinc-cadmium efflux system membrane fusion protein
LNAPFDGIVTKLSSAEGESIQPDTQLMELADISTVWVQADVFERDLSAVRGGQTAVIRLEAYPDEAFQGRVTYIGDAVDRETRTTRIRCEVPNPNRRLKLDMFATVQLPGKGTQSVLMVPQGAVQQLEGKQVVFVREKEQEFAIRPVKTGASAEGWVEIIEGVKPGETAVVRGSFVLKAEHLKAEMGEAGHSHD